MSKEVLGVIYKGVTEAVIDANQCKDNLQISASKWKNTPVGNIGILLVYRYSADWVVQKFYPLGELRPLIEYQRMFTSGKTWSSWAKIEYTPITYTNL